MPGHLVSGHMKMKFKPLTALVLALAFAAAACGNSDEASTVAGADTDSNQLPSDEQGDTDLPIDDQPNTDETVGQDPSIEPGSEDPGDAVDEPSSDPEPVSDSAAGDELLIGSANIGGEIVDPKPHQILDLAIAESYPEQLQISFMAGDENCLAATATAHISEDDSQVIVLLNTGITTDALTKSCLAGQFEHNMSIPLDVGLDGREIVMPGAPAAEPAATPTPTDEPEPADQSAEQPIISTLLGTNEDFALAAAEDAGYSVRVLERDGEPLAGTSDYREDRINLAIDAGVITRAWIG